jgi:hypothetical protein
MRTRFTSDHPGARTTGRTVFVSSSCGRAGNHGRSADAPLASLAEAVARVHQGRADRLLLRRGDVFAEPIGRWTRSGRSASAPAVVGVYGVGDERAVVRCRGTALELAAGEAGDLRHVLVTGIHFIAAGRDPDEPGFDRATTSAAAAAVTGIRVVGPGASRVTIEDCRVEQFDDDVQLESAGDVRLRRCVLLDVTSPAGRPTHHVAVYGCGGTIRIESCVFDQNARAAGASHHHVFAPHGSHAVSVTDCVVARSPGTALFLDAARNVVANNVLVGNRLHIAVGGAESRVSDNLVLGGRDRAIAATEESARRIGAPPPAAIWGTSDALTLERNLIAHRPRARGPAVVLTRARGTGPALVRRRAARLAGNVVYGAGGGIEICRGAPWQTLELLHNDLQRIPAGQAVIAARDPLLKLILGGNRYGMLDPADDASIRFRLGGERLTFVQFAARTGDASIIHRTDGTAHAARLPRRYVADARAQSGAAWRAHLSPSALIRCFARAFDLSRQPEALP